MKKEIVKLGEPDWTWIFRLFFLTPFWFLSPSEERKSWEEFKNGLIDHKCKYDLDKPIKSEDSDYYFFECLHTGCNIVAPDKSNCTECGKEIFIVKRDKDLKIIPELCISCKYPLHK